MANASSSNGELVSMLRYLLMRYTQQKRERRSLLIKNTY